MTLRNQPDCVPSSARWVAILETSSILPKAVWTQFAIAYYALGVIGGITVHDCQWHSEENMYSFQDADDWLQFASAAVPLRTSGTRRGTFDTRVLVELGLMSEDGTILF